MHRTALTVLLLATAPLFVIAAAACGSGGDDGGGAPAIGQRIDVAGGSYTKVTPAELSAMLAEKDFPLINVHIPYEGEIEGTDQFIPFDQIGQHLGELPSNQDARIVIYCRSGNMSTTAAAELVGRGYTNVWELAGGMIAWKAAGYTIVEKQS